MENTPIIQSVDEGIIDIETGEMLDAEFGSSPEGIDVELWNRWKDEEKYKEDPFLLELKRGILGHNVGLGNGLHNINKYIYGTHKARYYLIGADSSVGKTTIGDFMYILKAWENAKIKNRPIRIFYCSFEVGRTEKIYRWCSYYILLKFNVQLPADYIRGRIEGNRIASINSEQARMVLVAYSIITDMLKDIVIMDNTLTPTAIFEGIIDVHFAKHGTILRGTVTAEEEKKGVKGAIKGYTENDPNLITILACDHLALTDSEGNASLKITMDKLSKYFIVLRNVFYCTIIAFQQFSTDMMSTYRGLAGKKTEVSIAPQRLDFGDSKATFRDANVVMGLAKPQKEMENFMGYNLSKRDGLGDCFVALYLMKNREGPANRILPLFMDGITGYIYDLPLDSSNKILMSAWYERAQQIEKLCQVFSPKVQ